MKIKPDPLFISRDIEIMPDARPGKRNHHADTVELGALRFNCETEGLVEVKYDQLRMKFSEVLKLLGQKGFSIKHHWYSPIQIFLNDYLDTAARDNALSPPPSCCNKPPRKSG